MFVPHRKHLWAPTACNKDSFTVLYVDDICTSQEAQASTACTGDSFNVLYVDDVRTSQEAQASTACTGDSFTSYFFTTWKFGKEHPSASGLLLLPTDVASVLDSSPLQSVFTPWHKLLDSDEWFRSSDQ
jgi:hypothetical protein